MSEQTRSIQISLQSAGEGQSLFGPQDTFLKLIESEIPAQIASREAEIVIFGSTQQVESLEQLFDVLLQLIRNGYVLTERDVKYAIELAKDMRADQLLDLFKGEITTTYRGKPIRVKTIGQKHYVTTIKKRDIVFGIGPAVRVKLTLLLYWLLPQSKRAASNALYLHGLRLKRARVLGFCQVIFRKR